MADKVEVENVNHPGQVTRLDAAKYHAMRQAILKVMPGAPGMTQKELREPIKKHLPEDLFPGGEKSGWWFKSVQLDLEAKGIVGRSDTSPLRFFKLDGTRN